MEFWVFKAFDFGIFPSFSEFFWGVIGVILTIITSGLTFGRAKTLHKFFPAFSDEEVYRVANKAYNALFCVSSILLVGIIYYFVTKFIFFGLRSLGEAYNVTWLVQFTKTSAYGFGTMFLLVAGTLFFIYYLNVKKTKRNVKDKCENMEREDGNGNHYQSVL